MAALVILLALIVGAVFFRMGFRHALLRLQTEVQDLV